MQTLTQAEVGSQHLTSSANPNFELNSATKRLLLLGCAAQYNARILKLRRLDFNIENRTECVDGVRHSWFRLLQSPATSAHEPVKEKTAPADSAVSKSDDWYKRQTGKPRTSEGTFGLPLFAAERS
jgi:hypothetical protein